MQDMFALNIAMEEDEFNATEMQHEKTVRLLTHLMNSFKCKFMFGNANLITQRYMFNQF